MNNNPSDYGKMTLDRFQQLLDAYGGQAQHWPEQERPGALQLLANSAAASQLLKQALLLDDLLNQVQAHTPSAQLLAAVMDGENPSGWRCWTAQLWPFGAIWPPLGALACCALLGLVLGFQTTWPLANSDESSALLEYEVIQLAYGVDGDGEDEI